MQKEDITILIVGICASGKSSVVERLKELGFDAYTCAQEHSCVKSLWTKLAPDVLVVLDCDYETIKQRRKVQWGEERIKVQKKRLQNALENCDLYLKTDDLNLEETVREIIKYLFTNGLITK
ncbi:hypothetical protein [Sporohalobacter salinus]|uniref:hypothetical protein n=1 Tax=Sporohalobacter salinus TaxID=1494606 RepID=UPI001960E6F8|nr:hypothetical protein [Sporohalobacter salinus]MBM7623214.1 broad-specificity NMP kinase [Sporohalobacter salinus]